MEQSKKVSITRHHLFFWLSNQNRVCYPRPNNFTFASVNVCLLVSDEDYILQFAPPFNRLELLQAHSCPDVITSHLELL